MSVCVALLMVGMTVNACQGDTIALDITNPGFDADIVPPDPGYTSTSPTGWSQVASAGVQLSNAGLAALSAPNWVWLASQENTGGGIGQLLKVGGSALRVQAGGVINLSVNQGHRTDYMAGSTQQFEIQIWRNAIGAGALAYTTGDLGNVTPGTWALRSASYTATADDVGKDLYVLFWDPLAVQVQLDNASGSYVASIPEPSTIVMSAIGILGLLAYAWRKRR
jgi:hypothetical protein